MRTDRYSPSNIAPQEFTFVMWYHAPLRHAGWPIAAFRVQEAIEIYREAGVKIHGGIFSCDVCGAHFKEGELWRHDSGEIISVGHQCAAKYELYMDLAQYKSQKAREIRRAKFMAQRAEAWEGMRETLRENPGLYEAFRTDNDITRDIRAKFIKWGNISDKQIALVFKLQKQVAERAQRQAEEAEMAVDVPEGRQQLEGEVLSVKMKYTAFGDTLKMLVRVTTDEGIFKVWGTVPTNLVADIERNHVVRFTATLKRSDDRGFGFFSRPAKASIVEPSSVEV